MIMWCNKCQEKPAAGQGIYRTDTGEEIPLALCAECRDRLRKGETL